MKEEAMSEVLSTLVLTAMILLITIVAAFIANAALETQAQKSELEEAKSAFRLLADTMEEISSNPYASGYVRINCRFGRIEYRNCTFTLKVSVDSTELTSNTTSCLTFIGGDRVGFIPSEVIYGVSSVLINNSITPLISVYTGYANGRPFVSLNATRVRIVDRGTVYIKAEANNPYYHVFDIVLIRLIITRVQVSGSFTIIAHNMGIWTSTTKYTDRTTFTLTVSVIYDGITKEESMYVDLSSENIAGVLFNIITIEIDIEII